MSESDFMDITRNGQLCNANGEIGQREFQSIMRREVQQRRQLLLLHANIGMEGITLEMAAVN
jgi:hypothetical protein